MKRLNKKDEKFCRDILTDLVNIRSVSGEEEKVIKYIERLCLSLGLRTMRIPKGSRRSNLIISLGRGETAVSLNAHADTVPPSGNSRPRASIKNGRLL